LEDIETYPEYVDEFMSAMTKAEEELTEVMNKL
jgi:hypothetical protein